MKKVSVVISCPNNGNYIKSCELLHQFAYQSWQDFKFILTSIATKENEADIAIREFGESSIHKILFDEDISKVEDLAVKHALVNNCDLVLFVDANQFLTYEGISNLLTSLCLYRHETSIYDLKHGITVYKVESNGYSMVGVKDEKILYSSFVPTISGFKQVTVTENELPFKLLA
jgi:hypothetical protein